MGPGQVEMGSDFMTKKHPYASCQTLSLKQNGGNVLSLSF